MNSTAENSQLLACVIHNKSADRSYNRELLLALLEKLDVVTHEIYWQPDLPSTKATNILPYLVLLTRNIIVQIYVEGIKVFGFGISFKRVLKYLKSISFVTINALCSLRYHGSSYKLAVEKVLLNKHVDCWKLLLNSSNDLILILEDDATPDSSTVDTLRSILEYIESSSCDDLHLLADVAGGCDMNSVSLNNQPVLISEINNNIVTCYNRILPNTTCGYIINRKLAHQLLCTYYKSSILRLLPVDWFILASTLGHNMNNYRTFYLENKPFAHGSATLAFQSMIQSI